MKAPIKFRGYAPIVNRFVYGDLWQRRDGTCIFDEVWYRVDPKTVAQLVGYDKNGKEVYVGDTVRMVYNGLTYDYKAHLSGFATTEDGCWIPTANFNERELVEAVTS